MNTVDVNVKDEIIQDKNNGFIISDTFIVRDLEGNQLPFKNITKKHKTGILKHSVADCGKCLEYVLSELKKIDDSHIVIMVSGYPIRYLNAFVRDNKIKNSVFIVDSLGLPLESEDVPFFFILNEDMKVSHSFIPRLEYPEKTKIYFDAIIPMLKN